MDVHFLSMLFASSLLLLVCYLLLRRSSSFSPVTQNKYSPYQLLYQAFADDNDNDDDFMLWPEHPLSNNKEGQEEDEDDDDRLNEALDSILKIHCTHSEPDNLMPWQKSPQSTSTSSGFVISNTNNSSNEQPFLVITNAHSVEFASIIQVQRRGEEHKYEAKIHAFASECDLAILKVEDPDFWRRKENSNDDDSLMSTKHFLEFGPLPALQDRVQVLGYPTGGDSLSITQGVVSRIDMQEYTQSSSHLLAIQIDAAINFGNSGGPVVNEDLKVIGVAFQGLDEAENIGYVVPVTIVQHVLQDIQRNTVYTGFCSLGVGFSLLENMAFRKSLGMRENSKKQLSGVMVRSIGPISLAKGILFPNDVILSIDSIKVGNDGKIPFRRGERVALACYIHTKIVGDNIHLRILRDEREMDVDVPVSIPKRLVPSHWSNQPPPYVVIGGLVFTALSVPYLAASGAWDGYVSPNMSYLLSLLHRSIEHEMDQVVILIQVLAHRENLGYDTLTDLHLETLNGEPVRSLQLLKGMVDDCQEKFLRFEFSPDSRIVVLERSTLDSVTRDVCTEHSIQRPFFLHDTTTGDGDDENEVDDNTTQETLAAEMAKNATIQNRSTTTS